jgi:NAD(P)-dependent dehydrogenase (short-subunit alcohol dehydrogenase family)
MSRVAIVTGAGTGIGAAGAKLLAAKGLDVVLVGRRAEFLEAVGAEIGDRALVLAVDVRETDRIVAATLDRFGRIDIVVNNAAFIRSGPLESFTREVFAEHYSTNVEAPFFLVAAALPSLRESPDAAIVNVSSSVGSIIKPGNMLYGSTKAALEYLTRAWAYELAEDGIRVNCIAPGPVDTPIHATYSDDLDATYADLARRVPLGRMGHTDDLAAWMWFLVSPETGWTTGNVIHVDGGQVLGLPEAAGG